MVDLAPIRTALFSVSDKTDLVPFARALLERGVRLISTGGTARALRDAAIDVTLVEDVTGFPEMMGGRVKTLHPKVHGGILALRDNPEHVQAMRDHGIDAIDLVCVNLYPFERTVASPDVSLDEAIEQIDIGGPSMVRSAAKNFAHVTVVTDPSQYDRVISALRQHKGATPQRLRLELAAAAFARTCAYDAVISSFLLRREEEGFPEVLDVRFVKKHALRYGENPHQDAALYVDPASTGQSVANADLLHGKPISYNNILDASAAIELVKDARRLAPDASACCVVKHSNACGFSVAGDALPAVDAALAGDPLAAFGGVLACNAEIDKRAAKRMCEQGVFLEVIVAPGFDDDALEMLKARWQNVRLLALGHNRPSQGRKVEFRTIPGGMLAQDRDTRIAATHDWRIAAGPAPEKQTLAQAAFVAIAVKHLKSNAIAIGATGDGPDQPVMQLVGMGAGCVDRVGACEQAIRKADARARGAIAASDAFFPFPDGPKALIDAGVRVIVQPGGSKRDQETFSLCEARGVTCLITGARHFRH